MDLQLSGKVAIVTGASRGIGRAIAQTLAAEGMKISAAARSKDQLDDLAKSIGSGCLVRAVDLRQQDAAPAVVEATVAKFGKIDLLVNNAGATKRGDFFELTDEDGRRPDWGAHAIDFSRHPEALLDRLRFGSGIQIEWLERLQRRTKQFARKLPPKKRSR